MSSILAGSTLKTSVWMIQLDDDANQTSRHDRKKTAQTAVETGQK